MWRIRVFDHGSGQSFRAEIDPTSRIVKGVPYCTSERGAQFSSRLRSASAKSLIEPKCILDESWGNLIIIESYKYDRICTKCTLIISFYHKYWCMCREILLPCWRPTQRSLCWTWGHTFKSRWLHKLPLRTLPIKAYLSFHRSVIQSAGECVHVCMICACMFAYVCMNLLHFILLHC